MDSRMVDDGLPDDRVTCLTCQHCVADKRCKARGFGIIDVPLRCQLYVPRRSERDKRTGMVRWPTLDRDIAELRKLTQ